LGAVSTLLISVLAVLLLVVVVLCGLTGTYAVLAAGLPSPEALRGRSASFMSTQIYDRNGHLLYEILDPTGGRRILVPFEQIQPHLINATVATEDERFWQHPGVDPVSVLRAVVYNIQERDIVSGGSTIPQQLVRLVLFSPEERTEQSLRRKVREAVLAS
jgi:membrane peptidoglycan carboxypeptidase